MLANKRAFEKLPADVQQIIKREIDKSGTDERADIARLNGSLTADLKAKGLNFIDVPQEDFRKKLAGPISTASGSRSTARMPGRCWKRSPASSANRQRACSEGLRKERAATLDGPSDRGTAPWWRPRAHLSHERTP